MSPTLHRLRIAIGLLFVLVLAASARGGEPTTAPKDVRLTLVHFNDPHGQLEGRSDSGKAYGGYARLSSYVDAIRKAKQADRVFLIHAGDEFSKADELTQATQGRANIAILNHLALDMWVPGNGEYYGGLDVLRARMAEARFKTLAANVADKEGKLLADNYLIEDVGGAKVAFFGLGYIHAAQVTQSKLVLADPIKTAQKLVPELRKKADIVIAVTHIGIEADLKLAAAVSGLDLIIGGHSHTVLPKGRLVKDPDGKQVLICQAGEFLHYAGRVDLRIAQSNGQWRMAEAAARLDPLDQDVKLDPTVTAIIARQSDALTRPVAPKPVPAPVQ